MVTLDITNLLKVSKKNGLKKPDISKYQKNIKSCLKNIEKREPEFHKVIDDKESIREIKEFSKKNNFKDIVVLGIGGSALGAVCLQKSLKHLFSDNLSSSNTKLHVLDNIDPDLLEQIQNIIDLKKTLFIVISKSGNTVETTFQLFYFQKLLKDKKLDLKKHLIIITNPKNGFLRETATKENIQTFNIPQKISGRFSVLTPVGLLPAKLIGINIEKILKGAKRMQKSFLNTNLNGNLPFQLAIIQYLLAKKGKNINILMPYSQRLIHLSNWYRQLLAESIGKKYDKYKKKVNTGITPINALGVTDQHSQIQLYNEGPNDKLIIFIEPEKFDSEIKIPIPNEKKFQILKSPITFNGLRKIEKKATAESLTKNNRPNITIKVDSINEESIGALIMLFEGATAFLGELFNINAFDQPGVELTKKIIKESLLK